MIYSSPEFLIFFLATSFLYLGIPNHTFRKCLLLLANLIFMAWAGILDTIIFAGVIGTAWLGLYLGDTFPRYKQGFVRVGVVILALNLFFWKYTVWAVAQIQSLLPSFLNGQLPAIALPIGISFFTLQGIAYLVDYARGKQSYVSLSDYALYKGFFGQLIAGPIVRGSQLLPQLKCLPTPALNDLSVGISLFVSGLLKKLLIADRVAIYTNHVFASPSHFDAYSLLTALLGFTVQIWADFSGYTDMGRGAARILGIHLPENFLSPYFARGPSEFWRRWHITLSEWIKDYLYIPLGGSRGGFLRATLVIVLTMTLSGLWHGANWTFVLWGLYHGILLWAERLARHAFSKRSFFPLPPAFQSTLQILAMWVATLFGWLLFRANTVTDIHTFVIGLAGLGGTQSAGWGTSVWLGVGLCFTYQALVYVSLESRRYIILEGPFRFLLQLPRAYAGALAGAAASAALFGTLFFRLSQSASGFIYFQF